MFIIAAVKIVIAQNIVYFFPALYCPQTCLKNLTTPTKKVQVTTTTLAKD